MDAFVTGQDTQINLEDMKPPSFVYIAFSNFDLFYFEGVILLLRPTLPSTSLLFLISFVVSYITLTMNNSLGNQNRLGLDEFKHSEMLQ